MFDPQKRHYFCHFTARLFTSACSGCLRFVDEMISSPLLLPSELLVRERRDNRVWSLANPPAPSNSNFLLASHDADGAIAQFPRRLVHSSVSDNMFLTIGSICMS